MGDQRQIFRFRLPWLSAAAAPRPTAEPQPRPAAQTQAPAQPTTTIPIQRPPFRLAGIAPVQTTPTQSQAAAPPKTEPQPAAGLRARAATEPKAASRPASPPRLTNQVRAASVPPSPSRRASEIQVTSQRELPPKGTTQTQATSQVQSPSRAPTQATAASVPPPPSRIASEPQPTAQEVSKQKSPTRLATQPAGETSSQLSSPSRRATQVQPTLSPPKKLPTATQEMSEPSSSSQPPSSALQKTTFQPFATVKPSEASAQVKEVAQIPAAAIAPQKPKEREERKKVSEESRKAKTKGSTHEEPEQRRTSQLLAAATDERQIKTVSSTHPKDGIMPNNSQQKHVTSTWEQVPLHKEIREDISKFVHKLATGQSKLPTDEQWVSVLTLAGENRGAAFHLGSESAKKDGLVHIHRGYKINPDDSPDTTTDGEGSSRGKKPKDSITNENKAPRAYVNNNIQSVNNSIVFESSVNDRNPGVHLEFAHNFEEPTKSKVNTEPLDTRKAEFNITPAEKLTYDPTVRRRCLRGLFAESSDSDPENPEKPRRHGCRYSCGEKNKEKEIGIL